MQLHTQLLSSRSASRFSLAPLAAAIALLGATSAHAQDAPAEAATGGSLGTVTVSSERQGSFTSNTVQVGTFRDQSPLDVPLTTNVITREVIDAQGQRTVYGALRNTAGVTRSQLGGSTYDNIAIRGILVENRGNYRLNGSLPIINLVDVPLENKERVEVLKGASSLYYGFVPPSGIVNFVTKRAGATPVTSLSTSINDHGAADVHFDLGRKFGPDNALGLRINAVKGREDIGIDNFSGNRDLMSAAIDYKISPAVNLRLDIEHYRKDVSEQAAITLPTAVGGVITLPRLTSNKSNLSGGDWERYIADATNILARADIAFTDNWSAIFEVGQARNTRDRRFPSYALTNVATGAGTLTVGRQDGQTYENNNVRAELAGRLMAGSIAHELTIGYTANTRDQDSRSNSTITRPQNLYNPVLIAPVAGTPSNASTPSSIRDKGLYVFDRVTLSEQWQVMGGMRRSDYSNAPAPSAGTQPYSAQKTSPSVAVMYKPNAQTSVYASYIEGMEESGTAPLAATNPNVILPPALNEQVELGVKAEVAQGVLLQLAYFDVKRQYTTTIPGGAFTIGGRAQYRGLEFAATGEINKQWSVVASALLMDPKIISSNVPIELGKTPENAAKVTWSLFGEYRVPEVPGLALNAGVYYTGKRPVNNANQADIDGVGLLSLGARWRTQLFGTDTTLQANIDNLANKLYYSTAGNGFLGVGAPRTLRVAAKFDF